MSHVVDSSGWLEYLANGKNARHFATPIQDTASLIVPTICQYEVFKRVLAQTSEDDALRAIGVMSVGQTVDLDRDIALEAARLSLAHQLAMADSLILATARWHGAVLWTQDAHFQGLSTVKYIPK